MSCEIEPKQVDSIGLSFTAQYFAQAKILVLHFLKSGVLIKSISNVWIQYTRICVQVWHFESSWLFKRYWEFDIVSKGYVCCLQFQIQNKYFPITCTYIQLNFVIYKCSGPGKILWERNDSRLPIWYYGEPQYKF